MERRDIGRRREKITVNEANNRAVALTRGGAIVEYEVGAETTPQELVEAVVESIQRGAEITEEMIKVAGRFTVEQLDKAVQWYLAGPLDDIAVNSGLILKILMGMSAGSAGDGMSEWKHSQVPPGAIIEHDAMVAERATGERIFSFGRDDNPFEPDPERDKNFMVVSTWGGDDQSKSNSPYSYKATVVK